MQTRSLELPLTARGDPPSTANVEVGVLERGERLRRAGVALGAGFAAALIAIPIPLVHFFVVPGALIVGVTLAAKRLKEGETFQGARGRCPHCNAEQRFPLFGGFRLPKRLDCPGCHHDLYLNERAK
ncbi:MAG TPA: hypothetical protein VFW66_08115 [Gemmatimonadales bacterium]|nr:hypothetical protein [Gemmatimonadales bacterium]